jgi:hypothetical protein
LPSPAIDCWSEYDARTIDRMNEMQSGFLSAIINKIPREQMATLFVEVDLTSSSLSDLLELLSCRRMIPFSIATESGNGILRYGFDVLRPSEREEAALLMRICRVVMIRSALFQPIITPEIRRQL